MDHTAAKDPTPHHPPIAKPPWRRLLWLLLALFLISSTIAETRLRLAIRDARTAGLDFREDTLFTRLAEDWRNLGDPASWKTWTRAVSIATTAEFDHHRELLQRLRITQVWFPFIYDGQDLRRFTALPTLEAIELASVPHLTDIKDLPRLKNLNYLKLGNCALLNDLTPLQNHPTLEYLHLDDFRTLQDLTPIATLKNLRALSLTFFPELKSLAPLHRLPSLELLHIQDCPLLPEQEYTALQTALPTLKIDREN